MFAPNLRLLWNDFHKYTLYQVEAREKGEGLRHI